MLIDITLRVTPDLSKEAQGNQDRSLVGHLGTHFDVMNKEFPLEYTRRQGVAFDVSTIRERDITSADVDLSQVDRDMFVAFHTGYIEEVGYGNRTYFGQHPQLADELIDKLSAGMGVEILTDGGDRAYYSPSQDKIHLPTPGSFTISALRSASNRAYPHKR